MMKSGGENRSTALLEAGSDTTDGTNHLFTTYDSATKDNQQIVFQHNGIPENQNLVPSSSSEVIQRDTHSKQVNSYTPIYHIISIQRRHDYSPSSVHYKRKGSTGHTTWNARKSRRDDVYEQTTTTTTAITISTKPLPFIISIPIHTTSSTKPTPSPYLRTPTISTTHVDASS